MNRTALSVVALAVGSVLIIGLFNIYKPQTKKLANKVFGKVNTSLHENGMDVHHYDGVTYVDHGNGNIEFTHGTLDNSKAMKWSWNNGFVKGQAPKDIQHATSLKFDNVDVSHVHNMWGMLDYDPYVKSIDLGDNFDTSQVDYRVPGGGLSSMFDHDPNLTKLNLGSKFNTSKSPLNATFLSDPKLQWSNITGNKDDKVKGSYGISHTQITDLDRPVDGQPIRNFYK